MRAIKSLKCLEITFSRNVILIYRKPHLLKHKENLSNWVSLWEMKDEYYNNVTSSKVTSHIFRPLKIQSRP